MSRVYGVVLVGCGTVADYGHLPAIKGNRRARLVGVADCIRRRAKAYASKFGAEEWSVDYSQFLKRHDVDIVVVATPPSSHAAIIAQSLQAGKHVLCEKPLTGNLKDARRVIETVRETGKKLKTGYILRHNQAYQKARDIISRGHIGFPLVMRLMGAEHYDEKWQWERAVRLIKDTSPLIDCGCHYVDLMRWFTGSEAVSVSGIGQRLHPDVPSGNYDYGLITVRMKDESVGIYEVGWGYNMAAFSIKQVIGPRGRIDIVYTTTEEGKERVLLEHYSHATGLRRHRMTVSVKQMPGQFEEFLDCIEKDKDPMPELENAIRSLEIVLAGHKAITTGKIVSLDND